jgi:hypothetical protein
MHASSPFVWITAPVGAVACFVVFWCAICFLIGLLSGWSALGARYRKQSEPDGEVKTAGPFSYTVYMRFWSHYSGVIRLAAAEDALYASVLSIFRVGHPPLRIPWEEIEMSRTRYFWLKQIQLTLGNEEKIPMRISERMARNLGILDRVPK